VWRASTRVRVEGIVANHILPFFGARPLPSVRPSEVQTFVKGLMLTLSPGTVRGIDSVLCALYRAAVRDRLVSENPCVG
jgi:hypothetical protein